MSFDKSEKMDRLPSSGRANRLKEASETLNDPRDAPDANEMDATDKDMALAVETLRLLAVGGLSLRAV